MYPGNSSQVLPATDYIADLRLRLRLNEEQRPLVARARALQLELTARDGELAHNPAPWAAGERQLVRARLDALDALVADGWFSPDEDHAARLAAWLES